MEKRIHLYVCRKHPCLWLMVLCMVVSVALRIVCYNGSLWIGTILPITAAVLYALMAVLAGEEMLYRTAVPVGLMGLCFAIFSGSVVAWVACLLFCFCYTRLIDGRNKKLWLLPLHLMAFAGCIYTKSWADAVTALGMFLLWPAIKVHTDNRYHPTWGDRIDGRQVRTAQVMEQVTAYFMPNRTGANNLFSESAEITELEQYVRQKRKEGLSGFSITHAVLAAYARTVAKYPALNRFIAGQRIYSRGDDLSVCMTVKKTLTAEAPDSLIKVHLHPGDTAVDVYRKFNAEVENAKNEMETTADATVAGFMAIPRLVLKLVIWLLKCLDYFALVPKALLEISPFHGSIYFTNVGSLGIKPVYHHLYDFGTVPAFCAFGRKRRAEEIKDGQIVERKYLDMTFNLDERICDGFYYASVIKYFLRLLSHPEVLDRPPEKVEQDIP
ncbi:MAG: 2-oxo acid dehydrogenase subunit E2 [Oscillospiraceae bacterium]|nr:2-oxo acid dehydrogenase subunit E2 [Oscillospiraceae bacterium]